MFLGWKRSGRCTMTCRLDVGVLVAWEWVRRALFFGLEDCVSEREKVREKKVMTSVNGSVVS